MFILILQNYSCNIQSANMKSKEMQRTTQTKYNHSLSRSMQNKLGAVSSQSSVVATPPNVAVLRSPPTLLMTLTHFTVDLTFMILKP